MIGTCNMACWMAREDDCHCMCNGANHGVMRNGAEQPGRFKQKQGVQYRLDSIHEDWLKANNAARDASRAYNEVNGLQWFQESAFQQRASGHTLNWPEVQAFLASQTEPKSRWGPEAYLVWVRL